MEAFLELFGNMRVTNVVLIILAGAFTHKVYKIIERHFEEKYKLETAKEDQLKDILDQIQKYPVWRQQSIDRQKEFTTAIGDLQKSQAEIVKQLNDIEAKRKKAERNKLRDRLLQSFRYYTSEDKNPMLAWSEMEADAFWQMFKDYEDVDGDGHMHTVVQPAMKLLEEIPMQDTQRVAEVMQKRK